MLPEWSENAARANADADLIIQGETGKRRARERVRSEEPTLMNKPSRPVLTLARPPSKLVPTPPAKKPDPPAAKPAAPKAAKPAKLVPTPEQKKAARVIAEQEAARLARLARATAIRELTEYLMETYPATFPRPPAAPVPLAIGIHRVILEAVQGRCSNNTLKVFLKRWTDKVWYLEALAAGEPRRNLDGTLSGDLSEAEREVAAKALDALDVQNAKHAARASKRTSAGGADGNQTEMPKPAR